MDLPEPQSIRPASETTTGRNGQGVHRSLAAHTERLEQQLYKVGDAVWSMVGNGLSNQTFVRGPEGIIAIDTGESVQEMSAALDSLRMHTDEPVVAVIYTHYHYVDGTTAVLDGRAPADLAVWGHPDIARNRALIGGEISPVAQRGLVHQFGILLPEDGADAVENVGLGLHYRNRDHAPFTSGYLPVTNPVESDMEVEIAGLPVVFHPTRSDADDNITIWFPSLGVCVNNVVWPALFNVFAIRGEEYRDPQILLQGIDHIRSLAPSHLVGAHGPPVSGSAIERALIDYRDSIQFLWDQTVRAINKGVSGPDLGRFVQLPERFEQSYFTQQHYGLAEHHVRQIHAGLRGWFDGDVTNVLPLGTTDRADRTVAAMGGADAVAAACTDALANDDLRWALELAGHLSRRSDAGDDDQQRLAEVLRSVAERTTSANLRNWCLTRAREADGSLDLERFYTHRFSQRDLLAADDERLRCSIAALRVTLDPARCEGTDVHLAITIDTLTAGLHLRRGVAVPTDGVDADLGVELDRATWAGLLSGKVDIDAALANGDVAVSAGDAETVVRFFAAFEVGGLSRR